VTMKVEAGKDAGSTSSFYLNNL